MKDLRLQKWHEASVNRRSGNLTKRDSDVGIEKEILVRGENKKPEKLIIERGV